MERTPGFLNLIMFMQRSTNADGMMALPMNEENVANFI